eukprot:TRINITY_DN6949_c0_g1_i5.p1 TRINITY_DN6949_c0_g1~~TRINITY_DN6949_c0_g1_i5.p1  ORF type:complete len:335 (+),score=106.75 TRINITY_DN6949_c0_g1_i5:837-1841(+)
MPEVSSPALIDKAHMFLNLSADLIKSWSEESDSSKKKVSKTMPVTDEDFKEKPAAKSILKDPAKKGDRPKRSVRFVDDEGESAVNQLRFPQTQETLDISATLERVEGEPELKMRIKNNYSVPVQKLAIKFNKNPLGIAAKSTQIDLEKPIRPGKKMTIHVPLEFDPEKETDDDVEDDTVLEAALKTPKEVLFFEAVLTPFVFFEEDNEISKDQYLPTWKSFAGEGQEFKDMQIPLPQDLEDLEFLQAKVDEINLFTVNSSQSSEKGSRLFCSLQLMGNLTLAVLTIPPNSSGAVQIAVRSSSGKLARIAGVGLRQFFQYLSSAADSEAEAKTQE